MKLEVPLGLPYNIDRVFKFFFIVANMEPVS